MPYGRGSTRQSRKLRAQVLKAWPICYIQGPHCSQVSTQDDHVIPLARGGSDDISNHRGVCQACHADKSKHEAQAGRSNTSRKRPVEPHPGLLQQH